ncbi:hypothetical protein ACFXPA_36345 [Amycolatopsis sp. NPDC059090]|uniref:hypothetical protein n=1 Tax=unclassified Amycolatopsis TaxID=2618356 RepID=UPI00366CBE28
MGSWPFVFGAVPIATALAAAAPGRPRREFAWTEMRHAFLRATASNAAKHSRP